MKGLLLHFSFNFHFMVIYSIFLFSIRKIYFLKLFFRIKFTEVLRDYERVHVKSNFVWPLVNFYFSFMVILYFIFFKRTICWKALPHGSYSHWYIRALWKFAFVKESSRVKTVFPESFFLDEVYYIHTKKAVDMVPNPLETSIKNKVNFRYKQNSKYWSRTSRKSFWHSSLRMLNKKRWSATAVIGFGTAVTDE